MRLKFDPSILLKYPNGQYKMAILLTNAGIAFSAHTSSSCVHIKVTPQKNMHFFHRRLFNMDIVYMHFSAPLRSKGVLRLYHRRARACARTRHVRLNF